MNVEVLSSYICIVMMQKRFEKVAKLYCIYSNSSRTLNSRHPQIIAARSASTKKGRAALE